MLEKKVTINNGSLWEPKALFLFVLTTHCVGILCLSVFLRPASFLNHILVDGQASIDRGELLKEGLGRRFITKLHFMLIQILRRVEECKLNKIDHDSKSTKKSTSIPRTIGWRGEHPQYRRPRGKSACSTEGFQHLGRFKEECNSHFQNRANSNTYQTNTPS